jgi:ribosome maturation factor RimP
VDVEPLVRPVIEAAGYELVEAAFARDHGDRVLRVTVDRDRGVDLDSLTELSRDVSRELDASEFDPGPYRLEVSSPGIERPLRGPEQFRKAVGERVTVKIMTESGPRRLEGSLVGVDDEGIDLEITRTRSRVLFAEITSARTVADWDAELKRSNA